MQPWVMWFVLFGMHDEMLLVHGLVMVVTGTWPGHGSFINLPVLLVLFFSAMYKIAAMYKISYILDAFLMYSWSLLLVLYFVSATY
jgi:hypothetical protein